MIPLAHGQVPRTADAVVIGAGITGLAVAYELAGQGLKNIVVAEKEMPGSGSTVSCEGGIGQQWTRAEDIRLARESVHMFQAMSADLGYQVFFRQGGSLLVTESEDDLPGLRRAIELQNSLEVPSEFLQPEDCRRLIPDLDITHIRGASYCPGDGTAHPFAVLWGYARACRRRGVRIFTGTTVSGLQLADGRMQGVATERGNISSPVIVNCAGPWSRSVAAMAGVDLPGVQQRHEIMVSESLKPCLDPMVIALTAGISFSQNMRGEIVGGIGGGAEPSCPEAERRGTPGRLHLAVRFARALLRHYPRAEHLRLSRQVAGLHEVTPDHRPILGGIPGLVGYHHLCGFSGHRLMLGPAAGRRMAACIVSGRPDDIITSLSLQRFGEGNTRTDGIVAG